MPASIYSLQRVIASTMEAIASKTTTFNGTAFDTLDFEGDVQLDQNVGVVSGTTPTLDGKFQESDTSGGTYTDITGATYTQVTATTNLQTKVVRIGETKRFIRYVGTIGGTTPNFTMGVVFRGRKKYEA